MTVDIKKFRAPVSAGQVTNTNGETRKCTHLECKVYYSLGGYNNWTGRNEGRGYYMSISPVTIDGMFVSYTAFSGYKQLIVPCQRQGKKAAEKAAEIFTRTAEEMANSVFPNNGADFTAKAA